MQVGSTLRVRLLCWDFIPVYALSPAFLRRCRRGWSLDAIDTSLLNEDGHVNLHDAYGGRDVYQTYHFIAEAMTMFATLVMFFLVGIQIQALRRYRHKSFLFLLIGSSLGLVSSCVAIAAYLAPPGWPMWLHNLELRCLFYVPSAIFGVTGTVSLFRSYGELFKANGQAVASH